MSPFIQELGRKFLNNIIPSKELGREAELLAAQKRLQAENKRKFNAAMAQPYNR
jgi:hypothetical protein